MPTARMSQIQDSYCDFSCSGDRLVCLLLEHCPQQERNESSADKQSVKGLMNEVQKNPIMSSWRDTGKENRE